MELPRALQINIQPPTATPTNTPTATPTSTPTATYTLTETPTPTLTPTSSPTDTATTLIPTDTPTASPTSTGTSTFTYTPTPTATPATLQLPPSYQFSVEHGASLTPSIQLVNPGVVARSATLQIRNPYPGLAISVASPGPITVAPGETITTALHIDATSPQLAAGAYSGILLQVVVDDGHILYSNITVYVTDPGQANLPDLTVNAAGIQLVGVQSDSATFALTICNNGNTSASNVTVQLSRFTNALGEVVLVEVPAHGCADTTVTVPFPNSGDQLVKVTVDPSCVIPELMRTTTRRSGSSSQAARPGE